MWLESCWSRTRSIRTFTELLQKDVSQICKTREQLVCRKQSDLQSAKHIPLSWEHTASAFFAQPLLKP